MPTWTFSRDYIVWIYRHDRKHPNRFVETVEEVVVKGKRAFTTFEELWEALSQPNGMQSN